MILQAKELTKLEQLIYHYWWSHSKKK